MKSLDYWRLCEYFSVVQAAILIVGDDPAYINHWHNDYEPEGYEAVLTAIKRSIISKKMQSDCYERLCNNPTDFDEKINWNEIYIDSEEIKRWLQSKGITTGFFFPDKQHNLPYLDSSHPQYAPKLAVAVMAWEEVTNNPYMLKNKSPKKALEAWLELNAPKFELTKQAIEEIAKIANWNTKGGAPSTPSPQANTGSIPEHEVEELDDEIPF